MTQHGFALDIELTVAPAERLKTVAHFFYKGHDFSTDRCSSVSIQWAQLAETPAS